ncbi:SMC-Scp complex subunit ScpB, partial [Blastococcus sp. SYSU DS1024]
MTDDPTDPGPAPISWEALAAELAATREQAAERGDADPAAWDAVAAELAARVGERPVEEQPVPAVPAEDAPSSPLAPPTPEPQPAPGPGPGAGGVVPGARAGGGEGLVFVYDEP